MYPSYYQSWSNSSADSQSPPSGSFRGRSCEGWKALRRPNVHRARKEKVKVRPWIWIWRWITSRISTNERNIWVMIVSNKNLKKLLTTRNPKSSFSTALFNIKVLLPHWLAGSKTGPNGYEHQAKDIWVREQVAVADAQLGIVPSRSVCG